MQDDAGLVEKIIALALHKSSGGTLGDQARAALAAIESAGFKVVPVDILEKAAGVAEEQASYCLTQRAGIADGKPAWAHWTSLYAQAASIADRIRALSAAPKQG